MEIIGLKKGQETGLSKLVSIAKRDGLVVITRNNEPTAIIVSLSLPGLVKLKDNMQKLLSDSDFKELNPGEQEIITSVMKAVSDGINLITKGKSF